MSGVKGENPDDYLRGPGRNFDRAASEARGLDQVERARDRARGTVHPDTVAYRQRQLDRAAERQQAREDRTSTPVDNSPEARAAFVKKMRNA